jgi:hypothetical protein
VGLAWKQLLELRGATQFLQAEGIKLVEPAFALDTPLYELKIESVHRRIAIETQGLDQDARLIKLMMAVRDAGREGRCGAR